MQNRMELRDPDAAIMAWCKTVVQKRTVEVSPKSSKPIRSLITPK
jgi:hypothetical protein